MTDLKKQVLSLPAAQKREILDALQIDLAEEPIAEPIVQVLLERRHRYQTGDVTADPAEAVFQRLLKKYPGESENR